jgi:hypothetical protein
MECSSRRIYAAKQQLEFAKQLEFDVVLTLAAGRRLQPLCLLSAHVRAALLHLFATAAAGRDHAFADGCLSGGNGRKKEKGELKKKLQ